MGLTDFDLTVGAIVLLWAVFLSVIFYLPFFIQGRTIRQENLAQEKQRQNMRLLPLISLPEPVENSDNAISQNFGTNGENSRGGYPDFQGGRTGL